MSTTCPKCGFTTKSYTVGSHVRRCSVTQEELFWAKVNKNGPNGCWVWTGYCQKFGHGWTHFGLAHRYAWKILRGELAKGVCLLHHCDNPPCVNPDHLYIGNRTRNNADKVARGRHTRGEGNKLNKLTDADVMSIRARYKRTVSKGHTVKSNVLALAAEYGVSRGTIQLAALGHRWKHLPMPESLLGDERSPK